MKTVFISWSGQRGKHIAESLNKWLSDVVQGINIFISVGLEKGARGGHEIAKQLENSDFGIAVLTPESQNAQWINFESGALAKKVEKSRLCTFLYDMAWNEVTGPLATFQSTKATKNDVAEMVESVRRAVGSTVRAETIKKSVEKFWPELDAQLKLTPSAETPRRSINEMLLDVEQQIRATHPLGITLRNKGIRDRKDKHWYIIEGECAQKPYSGQQIIPIGRRGDLWWPQSPLKLNADQGFNFHIWLGDGKHNIYIVTPNELGRVLIDHYRRVYEETKRVFGTKLTGGKDKDGKTMDGMWIGIKMNRLPPGLELQGSIAIEVL